MRSARVGEAIGEGQAQAGGEEHHTLSACTCRVAPGFGLDEHMLDLIRERDRLRALLQAERRRNQRLSRLIDRDPATGILNRSGFDRAFRTAMAHVERENRVISLVYFDLDRFKLVNDLLGHVRGDELLAAIATRFVKGLRKTDVVARWGGDEFAILLWNTSAPAAQTCAETLAAAVEAIGADFGSDFLGASYGITALRAGLSVASAIRAADASMYASKRARRAAMSSG